MRPRPLATVRRLVGRMIMALGFVALIGGCGASEPPKAQNALKQPTVAVTSSAAAPAGAKQEAEQNPKVANDPWGDVTGRIVWAGDPKLTNLRRDLRGNADTLACEKNGPIADESWVVNTQNKGLRDTFVWLEPVNKDDKLTIHPSLKGLPAPTVEVDQPWCAFVPPAIALREGQVLVAKNSSPIAHNFKWTGNPIKNPGGGALLQPNAAQNIAGLVADRLPIAFECNIHPWMRGWARVFDHPYYAVADVDGKFAIRNAPVGECRIKVWHGSGGWLDGAKGKNGRPLTIKSGANDLGQIEYSPP